MKNIIIPILILFFCSCKKKVKPEDKKDSIKKNRIIKKEISLLDSIRNDIHNVYRTYISSDLTDKVSKDKQSSDICMPCDISFLVYLSKKDDYNLKDIKKLLCLDDNDVCDDNAEFVTFYNQMVFKVFERERKDLSFGQIDSLLKDKELVEELESPTSEINSKSLINILKNKK